MPKSSDSSPDSSIGHSPLEGVIDDSNFDDDDFKFQVRTENKVVAKARRIVKFLKESILFKVILTLPFFIALNSLYTSCDQLCPFISKGDTDCLLWANDRIMLWIIKVSITAGILCGLILLPLIFKILPKIISLLALANFIFLAFLFDNTLTFSRYGGAFARLLRAEVAVFFTLVFLIYLCIKFFRKSPKVVAVFAIIFFVVMPVVAYYSIAGPSCDNWAKGLDNEEIDNTVGCQIKIPQVCLNGMLDGMFDFSYTDCSSTKEYSKLIDIYPKAPIIGFPRIEYGSIQDKSYGLFQNYVLSNVVPLQSFSDKEAENLEVFIDQRDKENIQIKMNVKRNETLVKERSQIKSEGLSKNMLVIYLDALARPRIFKKMKKTLAWLNQYMNQKSHERETFQFFKFHAITPNTDGNLVAAYFGLPFPAPAPVSETTPPLMFTQTLKENGYILGKSSDSCLPSELVSNSETAKYMQNVPFDHEGNTFACDPNYYQPGSTYSFFTGPYSLKRRCAYGKDMFQHNLDYGNQFWRAYPEEKKVLWLDFIDAHEATQEAVKYLDDPLVNFLTNLDKDNLLKDTSILFWSDHGLHYNTFPLNQQNFNFRQERALPFLFVVLPHKLATEYRENIKQNQQQLTSGFQVYNFLMTFGQGKNSSHFQKSFLNKLPSATCEEVPIYMPSWSTHQCFCTYPKDDDNEQFLHSGEKGKKL